MAREIITHVLCDICLESDERRNATEFPPITFTPTMKPRVVALCKEHEENWYEPFRDMLLSVGQIPEGETVVGSDENKRRVRCIVPGCDSRPFKHKSSLQSHIRNRHNMNWVEAVAQYGEGDAAAQAQAELDLTASSGMDESEYTCEHCGEQYPPSAYSRPKQALAVHLAKAHGIRGKKHDRKGRKADANEGQAELTA